MPPATSAKTCYGAGRIHRGDAKLRRGGSESVQRCSRLRDGQNLTYGVPRIGADRLRGDGCPSLRREIQGEGSATGCRHPCQVDLLDSGRGNDAKLAEAGSSVADETEVLWKRTWCRYGVAILERAPGGDHFKIATRCAG